MAEVSLPEDKTIVVETPAPAISEEATLKPEDVVMADADEDDREEMLKAARQIEFYFADSNLPYDKFMWTLYTKDPEHWVPIQTVASFKRMRDFGSKGVEWVAKALRLSDFLEVDEAGSKVRRRTEVQEPKGAFERSIYAKGFGDEDSTLQTRLEEFFNKYGKTNAVRMRRDDNKNFKGSVFVEFTEFDTVDSFLKADPKPTWEGKELITMSKEAYCDMKIKEKGLTGKAANNRRDMISRSTRGFNAFREMEREKGISSGNSGSPKKDQPKKEVYLEFMGSKILVNQDEEGQGSVKEEDVPIVKGATLRFEGCGGDVQWTEIKDPIKEKFEGRAPFIKYSRGDDHGLVGFHKALSEEEVALVKETLKTINSHEVTWSAPSEEDEKKFIIERAQAAARSALSFSMGNGSSRDGGRGGRGGGRGRGGRGGGGRGGGRGGGGRGGGRDGGRDGGRGRGGRGRGHGGRGGGRGGKQDRNAETKEAGGDEQPGEKRKRAVEPDGGPDVGVRGKAAPPTIQSAKKVKTNEGEAAPAS